MYKVGSKRTRREIFNVALRLYDHGRIYARCREPDCTAATQAVAGIRKKITRTRWTSKNGKLFISGHSAFVEMRWRESTVLSRSNLGKKGKQQQQVYVHACVTLPVHYPPFTFIASLYRRNQKSAIARYSILLEGSSKTFFTRVTAQFQAFL